MHVLTRTTSIFRMEEGKRRYFDPGLTIRLFFAPNEGFLFQLWLVLVSVWGAGQAGTCVYTTLPQIMPRSPKAKTCALVVLTLRTRFDRVWYRRTHILVSVFKVGFFPLFF